MGMIWFCVRRAHLHRRLAARQLELFVFGVFALFSVVESNGIDNGLVSYGGIQRYQP